MPVVPPKGLVLVTGANGYLASVAIQVLLKHGYRVRGTVRTASKYGWMPSYFGSNFSLIEVPDFSGDDAFVEAIKGVDGVLHMAADVTFTHDPIIVDQSVKGITNILEASAQEASVKRVVLTSARAAFPYKITTDTWNDAVFEELKKPADAHHSQQRSMLVYAAAKMQAERAAFDFMSKNNLHFVFNSVVPNVNFGTTAAVEHLGFPSSSCFINALDKGYPLGPVFTSNQWFINTEDTVLLHLAALTLEEVQNERIMAMAGPFSWKEIIGILNRRFPERQSMVKTAEERPLDIGEVDNTRSEQILRKIGKPGFRSLEDSVVEAMESVIAADLLANVPRTGADDLIDMIFKGASEQ
ncbi:hypothetical protein B0I35DRAFT_490454 [Stachybotrys elegans]|uniref:NAD-dependent epimerase/dehydratase domain-containing protein n=1 Tax=Stachybotrys elegans TaxID=80388 RepID=A0A8K0SHC8_9HYPO|nr:hypothetical protein B0I35DRAFT_490454 [Stachybotrys elegans]